MTKTSSFTFSKAHRLLTPADYKQVFDAVGFKVHTTHLLLLIKSNDCAQTNLKNRLGLAISKAKMKHAHDRNRVKRLIREHFRLKQAHISHATKKQFDVVILVKKSLENQNNKQINIELDTAFDKLEKKLQRG